MIGKGDLRSAIIRGSRGRLHDWLLFSELQGPQGVFCGILLQDERFEFVLFFHFICECYQALHEIGRDRGPSLVSSNGKQKMCAVTYIAADMYRIFWGCPHPGCRLRESGICPILCAHLLPKSLVAVCQRVSRDSLGCVSPASHPVYSTVTRK